MACFFDGLREFDEALAQKRSGFSGVAKAHFEHANSIFQKSFDLAFPIDKPLAALCLKFQVQSCLELDTEEFSKNGLTLTSSLLNDYRYDLFPVLQQPDEIFFFQGILAGKISLSDNKDGNNFLMIAEKALRHVIESYPKSLYYEDAIESLGKLYYLHREWKKAEDVFLVATKKDPETLFLLSNISEKLEEKGAKWRHYREKLYQLYPDSPFAPEAYFRCYRYSDYVNGRLCAIDHLTELPRLYPESPYALNALYLLGCNLLKDKQKIEEGCKILREIEPLFDQLSSKGTIPENKFDYYNGIRLRAVLDLAFAELSVYRVTKAEASLRRISQELKESTSAIYEEAQFLLIKNEFLQRRNEKARDLCIQMIQFYRNANVTEGRYLAKILAVYAKIALRIDDPQTAIEYFKMAEKAGEGKLLTTDERLGLWIETALSYQAIGNLEEAMLTLSQVVNYNAISSRRLKVMYYRAMIYEAQGRRELAKNQLETVAKTQGKWAEKAKTQLKENYVY